MRLDVRLSKLVTKAKFCTRELIKRSKSVDKELIIFQVFSIRIPKQIKTKRNFSQDSSHHVLLDSPALAEKVMVDWVIRRIPNVELQ